LYALSDTIVGNSSVINTLRAYLPKVAKSTATVLITGETGTGKECVARALHELSPRNRAQFVAINCAAIPDSIIESELFGHERGAFTGAVSTTKGHVVSANGGTLFLDEIGEMSLFAQAKLLRVIENRNVTPVGSSKRVPVDVRIIAATNQPLENLVKLNRFRSDLFYRVNVARVELPPLKNRCEDIPLITERIIAEFNTSHHCSVGLPDSELIKSMMAHDWPGNIRELRNLVEAIFIDPPTGNISLRHLPPVFREMFSQYQTTTLSERSRLIEILEKTHWNKSEAAKEMNWSRMTLYRKLSKYHLEKSK